MKFCEMALMAWWRRRKNSWNYFSARKTCNYMTDDMEVKIWNILNQTLFDSVSIWGLSIIVFAGLSRKAQEGWMCFRPGGIGLDGFGHHHHPNVRHHHHPNVRHHHHPHVRHHLRHHDHLKVIAMKDMQMRSILKMVKLSVAEWDSCKCPPIK